MGTVLKAKLPAQTSSISPRYAMKHQPAAIPFLRSNRSSHHMRVRTGTLTHHTERVSEWERVEGGMDGTS